jgi:ABC-2 type transport system permease protein
MLKGFFTPRLLALMRKEFSHIRRDTRIVVSLIVPPALLLLLFGLVLNSKIENVRLGVIDQSGTSESRELIADLSVSRSFRLTRAFLSPSELSDAVTDGRVQAGLIIPAEFSRDLEKGREATVQFVLNAMDANTATVAKTYVQGVVSAYGKGVRGPGVHARFDEATTGAVARPGGVELRPSFLYNPGLFAAWFTVTGVLGMLCIVNSSLVASDLPLRRHCPRQHVEGERTRNALAEFSGARADRVCASDAEHHAFSRATRIGGLRVL